jgi:eukaryotic-like serine/threonine-protein kinase
MSRERLAAALADRYRIERELGAGGMATVYLAEDLKHRRKVAVKVLRPELAATMGPERFDREIEVAARLQHPHILALLDSGEADGFFYYVMPYVEGETLRDRLARSGELPVHEAVRLMAEIADALTVAHKAGVVHRDIKPENILLSGRHALVMDFGIAKAVTEAAGRQQLTTAGVALGTPAYMAPEQATADPQIDGRVDIYALGVVGYEMLTGRPPFYGLSAQQTLAAHVTQEAVPVGRQRSGLSPALEAVIMKCLAKRPADRFQAADELVSALEPLATPSGGMTPTHTQPVAAVKADRTVRWLLVGVGLVVLVAAGLILLRRSPPLLVMGHSEQLTSDPGLEIQPAISPDGKLVAYSAGNSSRMRVYLRPVGGGRTIPLSDDSTSVETHPQWSPDGSTLLFLTRGGVSLSPALGGSSQAIVPPAGNAIVTTATWSPSGKEIAFARGDSVLVEAVGGGPTRLVGTGAYDLHSCSWSPEGKWIACVAGNSESVLPGSGFGNLAPSAVVLFPAAGGVPVRLLEAQVFNQSPAWSPDGARLLLVSSRDGPRDIYALSLSSSGRLRGEPVRLTTGLGAISMSLSADGRRLVYAVYSAQANLWSAPLASGSLTGPKGATQLTNSHQIIEYVEVSHDGRWLLYDSDLRGNADSYRMPIGGGPSEQLTNDPADEFGPDLSPDGRAVAYHSFRSGTRDIEVKPLDGGAVEQVTTTPGQESFPLWSPDGSAIVFFDQLPPYNVFIVRRKPGGGWLAPERIASPGLFPTWSPDGRAIASTSAEPSDRPRLTVVSATGGTPRTVFEPGLSGPFAERALWSPDGRTLYFKTHDAEHRTSFWAVSAAGGTPRMLLRLDDPNWQSIRPFFATDGKLFYFPVEDRESDTYVAELSLK